MWPLRKLDRSTGPPKVGGLQPEYTSFPPLSEWSLLTAPSSALLYVLMFSLNCFQATIFVKTNNECDNSSVDSGELTQRPLWTVLVSTNNSASGRGCPDNKVLLLAWIKPSLLDVYTTFCIKADLVLMGLVVKPSTTTWVGNCLLLVLPPSTPLQWVATHHSSITSSSLSSTLENWLKLTQALMPYFDDYCFIFNFLHSSKLWLVGILTRKLR